MAKPDPYTTQLDPSELQAYEAWRQSMPEHLRGDQDYDLQGAFKANLQVGENGHLPDTFKKPNHMTFSDQSQYSNEQTPGGSWVPVDRNDESKGWIFNATEHNMRNAGLDRMQAYFDQYEPDSVLSMPDSYMAMAKPPLVTDQSALQPPGVQPKGIHLGVPVATNVPYNPKKE